MLFYFVIFAIIGILIGYFIKNEKIAIGIIITISIFWLFPFGGWAFLTLVELLIGYWIGDNLKGQKLDNSESNNQIKINKAISDKSIPIEEFNQIVEKYQPQKAQKLSSNLSEPSPNANTFTNSIGMQFVKIPAGAFLRTVDNLRNEIDELQTVIITKPFFLGIYPVTQEQWSKIMGKSVVGRAYWQRQNRDLALNAREEWQRWKKAYGFANPSWFRGEQNPVDAVSWEDAQEFIKRLNLRENTTRYRLPTYMEWELAARADGASDFLLEGDEYDLDEYAWTCENADSQTHPVGLKKPNPYGLYDMFGNVGEWVQDWQGDLPLEVLTDYTGPPSGENHVICGGRTLSGEEFLAINDVDPMFWQYLNGFRVAFSAD